MEENKYIVALGYISTCVPEMIIDLENPLEMMRQVYGKFDQLQAECDRLKAENVRIKEMYAANIGDEHDNCGVSINQRLQEENERLREALERYVNKFGNCGDVYDQAKSVLVKWVSVPCTSPTCRGLKTGNPFPAICKAGFENKAICNECFCK